MNFSFSTKSSTILCTKFRALLYRKTEKATRVNKHCRVTVSVDIRVKRIYRHLTVTPSFGGQIAGAGGTPRLSYLPCQTMELPLDGDNTKDS